MDSGNTLLNSWITYCVPRILSLEIPDSFTVRSEPIPMLGNATPLEAAKTEKGRQKLVDWLKLLENHSAKQAVGDPIADYDFAWLSARLGIAEPRR